MITREIRAYFYIRKNRFLKKKKVYQQAFRMMIDKTIAVYLVLLAGYLAAGILVFGDEMEAYQNLFRLLEGKAITGLWMVLTVLPTVYILNSFRDPGVRFSSSEYQLSLLSYSRNRIWLVLLIEKWGISFVRYVLTAVIVVGISPISISTAAAYFVLFMLCKVVMTVPQWKLFQTTIWIKLMVLTGSLLINAAGAILSYQVTGVGTAITLIAVNLWLLRYVFHSINWSNVMEASNAKIWNMVLIGYASKTPFKKHKKYSVFQHFSGDKRRFQSDKDIHHRLWRLYFWKNFQLVFKAIGALFLLLVVLIFLSDGLFNVGIAVVIYVYASISAVFFSDRMKSDILQVLPWVLKKYKQSFFKWAVSGAVVLLIPILIFLVMHWSMWMPLKLVMYSVVFLYVYQVKITKAVAVLGKCRINFGRMEGLALVFAVLAGLSGVYPAIGFSAVVAGLLLRHQTKQAITCRMIP